MFDSHGPLQMSTLDPKAKDWFYWQLTYQVVFFRDFRKQVSIEAQLLSEPGWCAVSILDMEEWWRMHTS